MYKSKEIRWYSRENNKSIEKWFSGQDKTFSTTSPRTDFYLPITEDDDISVKLREGNAEIKQRHNKRRSYSLTKNAKGFLEDWVRWGFSLEGNDELAKSIIKDKKYNWFEVYKERMGVKLTAGEGKRVNIHDIKERLPAGCQVEYTRLLVNGEEWFSFAMEWFGNEPSDLDEKKFNPKKIIIEILGDSVLNKEDSYGYNAFLNKNFKRSP